MFETSMIRAQAKAAPRRLSVLVVSIIAHTAVIFGTVVVSIASVDFPGSAPDEYAHAPVFAAVQIPPPLGNPNGGAVEKPQTTQPAPKPPASNEVTAPAVTPDEVKPADTPSTATSGEGEGDPTATEVGPKGVPWGDPKSITGLFDGPPVVDVPAQPQVEEKIYQPHEVVAPVLLSRVAPRYPASLIKTGVPATVVVRCIIDKHGNVRDPEVIVPASLPPFNNEVLRVLSQWRYKPATYGGQAVDSYLNLTVKFEVKR